MATPRRHSAVFYFEGAEQDGAHPTLHTMSHNDPVAYFEWLRALNAYVTDKSDTPESRVKGLIRKIRKDGDWFVGESGDSYADQSLAIVKGRAKPHARFVYCLHENGDVSVCHVRKQARHRAMVGEQ